VEGEIEGGVHGEQQLLYLMIVRGIQATLADAMTYVHRTLNWQFSMPLKTGLPAR
jgi:hypothetical protein